MSQVPYILTSTVSGLQVGVSITVVPPGVDQPVILSADLANWLSSRNIIGGGAVRLGVGGYQFTTRQDDLIIATDIPEASRDWFLFPTDEPLTYRIAADPDGEFVWTAFEETGPIMITQFSPGHDASIYQFRFTPLLK